MGSLQKAREIVERLISAGFEAYLAEYERQTQKLIMNPADRKRIKFLRVPLP